MASKAFVGGRTVAGVTERARSFGAVAAAYAEHRPGYPAAAVAWALAPAPGSDVLDLGAGTGKLTEALVGRPGVRVTAVDPTLSTHSWALISDPADRDEAMARVRAYLATCSETSSGAFGLPLRTEVIRVLRR
jgi:SAM-dependent methyltransferase